MADFEYTYSAPEQAEIRRIREKYLPKEESTLEKLRKLDAKAEQPGTVVSLILGICGTLVFGVGLCCCLVWELFALGIMVGVIGMAMLGCAYPAYAHITKKQREKLAPEILRLTDELSR